MERFLMLMFANAIASYRLAAEYVPVSYRPAQLAVGCRAWFEAI